MCSKSKIALLFLGFFLMQNLNATTRECVVCGSFYSQDKTELSTQINTLFKEAKTFSKQEVNAIIVPHAGYVFSAQTATTAYKTLHKKYRNIFLIGSSHHINTNSASIYSLGNYKTPLGEVPVNQEIVSQLIKNNKLFSYQKEAHTKEHTLEVQLPFLQTLYSEDLNIVPIIIASSDTSTIYDISQALKPYFNGENLFVISTDLSHYPSYEDAKEIDMKTLNAIATNDTQVFINNITQNESSPLKELYTSACGWSSVLMLMYLTQEKNYKYELLEYINSGDTHYGDKQKVVGYGSMRIYKDIPSFSLSDEEKKELHEIAKLSLYEAITNQVKVSIDTTKISPKLKKPLGAFVTLYKNGSLRGCIGRFEPNQPLYEVIVDMAISAALHDTRFNRVTPEELSDITIEISVLTPRKKINSIEEVVVGRDGIYVQKGSKNGTYLPHVATQMNWKKEEFVKSCAEEKAGISPKEFQEMELFTYEAIVF